MNFFFKLYLFFQARIITNQARTRLSFPSKTKTTCRRLKLQCIKTVNMQFTAAVATVQSLEEVMTCTSEIMQTQTPNPTQILVLHTDLPLATVTAQATPKLFWLAVTTSVPPKLKCSTYASYTKMI